MKPLQQMLRDLARSEVTEFAVVSDRLPCIKIGDKYEPVDDAVQSTEAILALLVAVGGSRYVDDLEQKAAHWMGRADGVGPVEVHAMMRGGRVQARITPMRRPANAAPAPPPHAAAGASGPKVAEPTYELAYDAGPPPSGAEGPSDPMLRAALVRPATPRAATPEVVPELTLDPPPTRRTASARSESPATRRAVPVRRAGDDPVGEWLQDARNEGASDLHAVAGRPLLLRLAGELVVHGEPLSSDEVMAGVMRIVPDRLQPVLDEHGSCDFAFEREDVGRFRVNVTRQRTGLKACFRCIGAEVPTLESLGLPPEIERATHHHQGLVLVTGPTGHGKTSTLAAIVDIINRETTHHVITVEDPVEFVHSRKKAMISQREVGSHTRSFANALKGSLREDPDVIVVGELRDTETVRMALAASETGHLVLGTMNTPSAAKTIDRLVDLFPPADQQQVRMTLAGGLHLVVGQRLLPATDQRTMVAAVELLPGSIALWNLIRDSKTFQIPSLQQRGKGVGIFRLDESLADLVKTGRTTREAALGFAESPDELEAILGGKRAPAAAPPPEAPKKPDAGGLLGKAGQIFGKRGA